MIHLHNRYPEFDNTINKRYTFIGVSAGTIGTAALMAGAGTNWFGLGGKKKKKGGEEGGYPGGAQWLSYPQYPWTEPRQQLTSDFISQNIKRLMEGQPPIWWGGMSDILRKGQRQALGESYYGTPFSPGVFEQQTAYDISRGRGRGGAAGRAYGGHLSEYAKREQDIEREIAKFGYEAQARDAYLMPMLSGQQPYGPTGQYNIIPPMAQPPSNWETMFQGVGSMLPYMNLSSMFSGAGAGAGGGDIMGETYNWPTFPTNIWNPAQVTPWGGK